MWEERLVKFSSLPHIPFKPDTQPGPPQGSKMESFTIVFNGFQQLPIVTKLSFLDICGGSDYTSTDHSIFSRIFSLDSLFIKDDYICKINTFIVKDGWCLQIILLNLLVMIR